MTGRALTLGVSVIVTAVFAFTLAITTLFAGTATGSCPTRATAATTTASPTVRRYIDHHDTTVEPKTPAPDGKSMPDGTEGLDLTTPSGPATPLPCPGAPGSFTGLGGNFPPQPCSIRPDPTTGHGCLTPRTLALARQLQNQGWRLSCWDAHAWNPTSDHPLGRACDVFPGRAGNLPTPAQKRAGDSLAAALQSSSAQTGVHYLIWYGRIWDIKRDDEGWRTYNGGGIYNPRDITGGHYDHIHISLF